MQYLGVHTKCYKNRGGTKMYKVIKNYNDSNYLSEYLDLLVDRLEDEYQSYEEFEEDIQYTIDGMLIYDEDKWDLMKYVSRPEDANLENAVNELLEYAYSLLSLEEEEEEDGHFTPEIEVIL